MGTAGVANASGFSAIQNGCYGRMLVEQQTGTDGSVHDYAMGQFDNETMLTGWTGWTCKFVLQRSTDGGKTWYNISSYHTGSGGDQSTYWYYDGPGYEARVTIYATNQLGNWTNIAHTDGY